MITLGLKDLGYVYINIDDCWMNDNRTADGNLIANTTRFPAGMKDLGNYTHELGLKYGLYESAGFETC